MEGWHLHFVFIYNVNKKLLKTLFKTILRINQLRMLTCTCT